MAADPSPTFRDLLRSYRRAAGLSQEALAERAGVSARAVSDLERGRRQAPFPHTVTQLARALQLSAADRARLLAAVAPRYGPVTPEPAAPAAPRPATNLPLSLTSFVGRERELAEVRRRLGEARLLTLTGAGGVGKTRLALELARAVRDDYPAGVWLVELAPLADPRLVPQAAARALGVREQPGRPLTETLTEWLAGKRLLLLLDNCEHLLDAGAALAEALLRACPGVRVLATSREALRVGGELAWRAPSLALPEAGDVAALPALGRVEAVRLFVERAGFARPGFALTEQNAAAVAEVCRRLDGVPLAIELAAARVQTMTVAQLARRLDDRFHLLTGGGRTALPRQQTLRATLDWSHDLLSEPERVLFRRLAVFAGGWTLAAAEAVGADAGIEAGEVLDRLSDLVGKSLAQLEEDEAGEGRYRLLETVRQYALERLRASGEAATVQGRHRDWCLALAERAAPELHGPDVGAWLARLEAEHDNLRAALAWSLAEPDGAEAGLRLAAALGWFWIVRDYQHEGRAWLERALARGGVGPARAAACCRAAHLAWHLGDFAQASARLGESLALGRALGDRRVEAYALGLLGIVAANRGDEPAARADLEAGVAVARAAGDRLALATALLFYGAFAPHGEPAEARAALEESLALLRAVGDRFHTALALSHLGEVAMRQGELAAARAFLEEGVALQRCLGMTNRLATSLSRLGWVARLEGDHAAARALYAAGLTTRRDGGDRSNYTTYMLAGLAGLAAAQGQAARAARLFGAAAAVRAAIGNVVPRSLRAQYERDLAAARAALGEASFAAAWAAGQALTPEEAVAEALAVEVAGATGAAAAPAPAARPGLPCGLSRREVEVLGLLAGGASNAAIAEELSISVRTVHGHVASILGKTGGANRTAAAAFARDHGLA